jgi:hypothetical protein
MVAKFNSKKRFKKGFSVSCAFAFKVSRNFFFQCKFELTQNSMLISNPLKSCQKVQSKKLSTKNEFVSRNSFEREKIPTQETPEFFVTSHGSNFCMQKKIRADGLVSQLLSTEVRSAQHAQIWEECGECKEVRQH